MTIFVLADAILGAATIRQVTSNDNQSNQEHRKAMTSGGNTVQQVSGKTAAPMTTFTSEDLKALLVLNSGTFVSNGLSELASTITIPYKARANAASFAATSIHPSITGSNALIVPQSLEVTQDSDAATMQCEVHWLSANGTTSCYTSTITNALAAQAFNERYSLGPVYINAAEVVGVQGIRVSFGIEVVKPPIGKGLPLPTFASIKAVIPTIEITVNDFAAVATEVGEFTAMTSAVAYLRLQADAGIHATTGNDVSLTFAGGLVDVGSVTASGNEDGSGTITLHGKTLTTSVAVTIP